MKKYTYTYNTKYKNGIFQETYLVEASCKENADYIQIFGGGDLITKHEGIGRPISMEHVSESEED